LSTPIIAGAVASELLEIVGGELTQSQLIGLIVGIISAAIVGYASIAFLLRYLATHNTFIFIYYRIALGVVVYLAFWSGFR
jgi:undecaprenyl-diphosphatase